MNTPPIAVQWNCAKSKDLFARLGIKSFEDFWLIEDKESQGISIDGIRRHKGRFSRQLQRHTSRICLSSGEFFLKRASGASYKSISRELSASLITPQFGLEPPPIAGYASDPSSLRGFVLFKKLESFHAIQELLRGAAPQEILEKFGRSKNCIYERIFTVFQKVQNSAYYYPDWRDKHIFWNPDSDSLALIDLERFHHLSERPAYARLPLLLRMARKKEQKTLAKALGISLPELRLQIIKTKA
ncbi:MAG: hypothetical protein A2X49_16905 [Lentisphaerae bacterium GWF2_52_8]|nr:MAG: hypothetical protein A2X49_16905 [Lentisphaerae bacterium GWF2_52_8]